MENNKIMVSVSCITYNQKDYISDAIESFLMQKTNFDFEILIHDDASTDGTAEIVKSYEKKYPSKIRGIYQKENQYSQGKKITLNFLFPLYKGKYIAFCEGDDYWTDEYKLQKQFDYLEKHQECSMCVHNSLEVDAETKAVISKNIYSDHIKTFDMVDAIQGLGRLLATNSFFCKRSACVKTPKFSLISPCGDYITPITCAEDGLIVCLPEIMSAHRSIAKGSMSMEWKNDISKQEEYSKKYEQMLNELNIYTENKYKKQIENELNRVWYRFYLLSTNSAMLKREPYKSYRKALPLKTKIRHYFLLHFKFVFFILRKVKHYIFNIFGGKI